MAGMEHIISMEEMIHSRKVEINEVSETSKGHDQPVIVSSTAIHGETDSEEENFMKLMEAARVNWENRWTTQPKIQKVLLLRDHEYSEMYCKPRVISIGPIHHGNPRYQLAEDYKLRLAANFIEECGKTDKELYMVIKNNIEQLRKCFDEEVIHNYNDEALSWMLFVDGCAILKFIDCVVEENVKRFRIKNSQVAFVQQDLFLLENQLPYRVLDDLIKNSREGVKLRKSVKKFINMHSMMKETQESTMEETQENPPIKEPVHLLDLLRNRILGCTSISPENNYNGELWHSFRNIQELKAVGIHLKFSNDCCLRNITFIKKWNSYGGTLSLPPIIMNDSTGPKFFNLIAYEMCPDFENDDGVTSYISFLNSLIEEPKDVIDLRKAGILYNFLGSNDEVIRVFNEIGTDLVPNPEIYRDVCCQIQQFYNSYKVVKWIYQALYTSLNNPLSFRVLAFTGAVLALFFTLLQTIYTIASYEYQRRH